MSDWPLFAAQLTALSIVLGGVGLFLRTFLANAMLKLKQELFEKLDREFANKAGYEEVKRDIAGIQKSMNQFREVLVLMRGKPLEENE